MPWQPYKSLIKSISLENREVKDLVLEPESSLRLTKANADRGWPMRIAVYVSQAALSRLTDNNLLLLSDY